MEPSPTQQERRTIPQDQEPLNSWHSVLNVVNVVPKLFVVVLVERQIRSPFLLRINPSSSTLNPLGRLLDGKLPFAEPCLLGGSRRSSRRSRTGCKQARTLSAWSAATWLRALSMPFTRPSAVDWLILNSPCMLPFTSSDRSERSAPPAPPPLTAWVRPPPKHNRTMISAVCWISIGACAFTAVEEENNNVMINTLLRRILTFQLSTSRVIKRGTAVAPPT